MTLGYTPRITPGSSMPRAARDSPTDLESAATWRLVSVAIALGPTSIPNEIDADIEPA